MGSPDARDLRKEVRQLQLRGAGQDADVSEEDCLGNSGSNKSYLPPILRRGYCKACRKNPVERLGGDRSGGSGVASFSDDSWSECRCGRGWRVPVPQPQTGRSVDWSRFPVAL